MMMEKIRFFGRRKGKAITGIRAEMLEKWLPDFIPKVPTRGKIKLSFGIQPKKSVLEVGFGGGEHLAELAKRQPDTGFLGAEVFLNGVASLLAHLNGSHRSGTGPRIFGCCLKNCPTDVLMKFMYFIRILGPKKDTPKDALSMMKIFRFCGVYCPQKGNFIWPRMCCLMPNGR